MAPEKFRLKWPSEKLNNLRTGCESVEKVIFIAIRSTMRSCFFVKHPTRTEAVDQKLKPIGC